MSLVDFSISSTGFSIVLLVDGTVDLDSAAGFGESVSSMGVVLGVAIGSLDVVVGLIFYGMHKGIELRMWSINDSHNLNVHKTKQSLGRKIQLNNIKHCLYNNTFQNITQYVLDYVDY